MNVNKSRFLIDTNVLSELAKVAPNEQVINWFRSLVDPTTSAVCCYEIARGIELLSRSKRRTFLESWFSELLNVLTVLPMDESSALAAARIESSARRSGKTLEIRDLFILATAQAHGCAVATRNVDDFRGLGHPVFDPFSDVHTL
jgi:toxin FitB